MYGFVPIVFFVQPPLKVILIAFVSMFCVLVIVWTINIIVFQTFDNYHSVFKYILSYILTMAFMLSVAYILFQFWERPNNKLPFPYYPAFTINTLVLILMNQVRLKEKKDAIEHRLNQSKIKQLEAEKQVLAQQLQPHFLFNALSTLKSFIKVSPYKAESYIVKLAEFLRFSLEANRDILISMKKELTFVNDYLDLQQLRFGDSLQCTTTLDSTIMDKKLPVFALQSLIENAIKHNGFTQRNPLYIKIFNEEDKVTVSNKLIPCNENLSSTLTGLNNLEKRYQMFGIETIKVEKKQNMFSVTVPLFKSDYEKRT